MPTSTGTYDTSTITYDQSSLSYDGYPAPLSGMPAVGVFVAFAGQPYEVNPAFTEISQYVRQITIRRGRQDDLQQFPPGAAQLVLDNRDRLFDPFNDGRLATRTNLVPNPSFEVDTSNCEVTSPAGSTIATTTSVAVFGSSSLAGTTAATTGNLIFGTSTVTRIAVTPSLQYTASGYIRSAAVSRTGYIRILFYNAAGSIVQTTNAANITTSTTIWTRSNVTVTAPATAVTAVIQCVVLSVGATETHYVDGLQFEQASAVGTYFDGSSTDGLWTGVPNNSTSQLKVYRRNLVTNPSFEVGTTGWAGNNGATIAQTTTDELYGTASVLITQAATQFSGLVTSTTLSISAGVPYVYSAYLKIPVGQPAANLRLLVHELNSAGTIIAQPQTGLVSYTSANGWTRVTVAFTANAATVSCRLHIINTTTTPLPTAGQQFLVDGVMLEQASSVGDYFDGSLAGAFNFGTPQWEGTANASTSVMRKFPLPSQLSPRDQIKIVANWNGVEYPLYRGYVAGWPVEYADGGTDSTVTIDCFDLLGLLATETAPSDWANYYTKSLDVRRYWQLNDSASATTARDQPRTGLSPLNVPFSRTGIYPAFDKSAMADGLTGGSLFFTYASGATNQAPTYTKTNATVTLWMNFSTSTPGFPAYCDTYVNNSYISIQGTVEATQSRVVVTADNGTTRAIVQYTFPTNPIPFFYAALITINVGGTPTVQLYRNLQLLTPATSSTIGGTAYTSDGVTFGTGQFQEVATFDRLLTVDEITLLYNVQTARLNETSTARVQRVLATTDVPTAMVSLPSSPAATVSEFTSGDGVMPQLQLVANSENAPLYVDDAGVLVLKQRDYYATDTRSNTSQVTFTDTGSGVEYDAGVVRLDFNADQVRNDVNVTFTGGGVINERDDTSIGAYGAAEWSLPTLIDTADNSDTLAQRLMTIYKNPKMTLEPFMSKGQQDPTYNWPRLLGLELLDRVTFKRTPATGSAIVKDLLVQSIEHRITPGEWQTVVNGSARYTNWFILGVSLLGSDDLLLN